VVTGTGAFARASAVKPGLANPSEIRDKVISFRL
jgi:hypothetical protein